MKRALKILGAIAGTALALVLTVFVAAIAFVDLDKLVNEQVTKAKPGLEERLGRKVSIGKVTTRVFPLLGGRIESIVVAADPAHQEDDQPLLKLGGASFDVALFKAVFSLGKRIDVTHIDLEGLQVSVVRYADGRMSFQDLLERQPKADAEAGPDGAPPHEGMSPETQALLQGASVERLRVKDASVRLVDHQAGGGKSVESVIGKVNLRLDDLRLGGRIGVELDAAVFTDAKNFELKTSLGPLPADLKLVGLPKMGGLSLRAKAVDLSRLAPYLSGVAPKIDSARFSADLQVGAIDGDGPVDVKGSLALDGLELGGGKRFDLKSEATLRVEATGAAITGADIEKLELTVGAVKLAIAGALKDLGSTPKFKDFTVRSTTFDPGALLSYYPEAGARLPKGTRLAGAGRLEVNATGDAQRQTVKAELDLTPLDVLVPDVFVKPPGIALALHLDADFTSSLAQLRRLGLELDELDLNVAGSVRDFAAPAFDLELSARPFGFDHLVRLLPAAQKSLTEAQAKAEGDGKLTGHVRGSARAIDAALEVGLIGAKLDVPAARVDGDLRLSVSAKGDPKKDLAATLDFDADRAVVIVPGKVNKSASTPWRMKASVERQDDRLEVKALDLRFAELSLTARGQLDLAAGTTDLKLDLARLDLEKLARTVTAMPPDLAKGGFLSAKLALRGNPQKLETMQLVLRPLDARLGPSDLSGEATVENLARPKVTMAIHSSFLDLDQLFPPAPEAKGRATASPRSPQPAAAADDPSLKAYRLAGAVDARRVRVRGNELKNFRGRVRLEDGLLTLEDCTFGIYDGTVSATGTRAEIWKARMPFKANLSVKGVEVNKALSAHTRYGSSLYGKADFDTHLSGDGVETRELEEKLLGQLTMSLKQGRLGRAGLTEAVLGDFKALEQVPGLNLRVPRVGNALKDLVAQLEVHDGKMTLSRPMAFSLDGNRVTLGGAIGIAGGLFLQGEYFVSGALLNAATGGRCKSSEELRVPITVGGRIEAPEFRPDGKAIALSLARRCLTGTAGGKVLEALGVGGAGGKAQADDERLKREKAELENRARKELEAQEKKARDALEGLFRR